MKVKQLFFTVGALFTLQVFAQDSVDVTFRYNIPGTPSGLSVPGQFNGWNNAAWPMAYQGGTLWTRNARLAVGGNPGGPIVGVYQYKFYYTGASPWPNDPSNHHVNPSDNDNSFIIVKDPTIYHFLPNNRTGTVSTDHPTISAYIFPKVGTAFDTSNLALTIDGATIAGIGSSYNVAARQMSYTPANAFTNGSHTVILRAGTTLDTVNFIVQVGGPTLVALPSYAKHGITLPSPLSNDSTTFRLRVGATNFVAVRVAPLGQPVAGANAVFMRKNPSSDDWWVNVSLPAGTYEYQFQTASGMLINDPWGRFSGTYGTRFTIGPEGLTADNYVWRSNSYQRPPLNKLVVYEMHIGEFAGGFYGLSGGQAGFSHLTTLIPYLDSLGVNAIELMPIMDYGNVGRSGHSWGYDLNHYFAIEPAFGTPRDFKVLVDSAHARGIAVILDVVYNHQNDTGPLWQMQPDAAASPYFKECSDLRYNEDQLCFFRDMDNWTPETQELVYTAQKMWIDEYRVDGFRYDFTQGIGWNINEPAKGILGWSNKIDSLYQGRIYQIAEHLPESPALVFYSGLTGGWHDSFHDEVFKDLIPSQRPPLVNFENLVVDLGAYSSNDTPALPGSYANRTEPINAANNHDEQSLIYEMTQFQGVPLNDAVQRDKLYATFIFASLGVPMLWEGQEFSAPRGWPSENQKLNYRPVEWSFYPTARGQSHFAWYKALIRQRKRNPALFNGVLRRLFRYDGQKTLVWGFEDVATTSRFVAVANLTSAQQTISNVPWVGSGTFYNILDQTTLAVTGGVVPSMNIPAYTAVCYSSVPDSILLDVKPTSDEIPTEFALSQNYPNPFNPSTKISFSLKDDGFASLKVFDILGREVATLVNEELSAGKYELPFDARGLSSGVYFYKLVSGSFVETKKMMVTK